MALEAGVKEFRETNETVFIFSVFLPVPVWDCNQVTIYEASQLMVKSEADQQDAYQRYIVSLMLCIVP